MRGDGGWGQDVPGPVIGWGGQRVHGGFGTTGMWSRLKIVRCPGLTEPRRMTVPSLLFWIFSYFTYNFQPLCPLPFVKAKTSFSALVTEQGSRFDTGVWWRFGANGAVRKDSGDFITARRQTQGEKIEAGENEPEESKNYIYCFNTFCVKTTTCAANNQLIGAV